MQQESPARMMFTCPRILALSVIPLSRRNGHRKATPAAGTIATTDDRATLGRPARGPLLWAVRSRERDTERARIRGQVNIIPRRRFLLHMRHLTSGKACRFCSPYRGRGHSRSTLALDKSTPICVISAGFIHYGLVRSSIPRAGSLAGIATDDLRRLMPPIRKERI